MVSNTKKMDWQDYLLYISQYDILQDIEKHDMLLSLFGYRVSHLFVTGQYMSKSIGKFRIMSEGSGKFRFYYSSRNAILINLNNVNSIMDIKNLPDHILSSTIRASSILGINTRNLENFAGVSIPYTDYVKWTDLTKKVMKKYSLDLEYD